MNVREWTLALACLTPVVALCDEAAPPPRQEILLEEIRDALVKR
jgi:hypothetical protein